MEVTPAVGAIKAVEYDEKGGKLKWLKESQRPKLVVMPRLDGSYQSRQQNAERQLLS